MVREQYIGHRSDQWRTEEGPPRPGHTGLGLVAHLDGREIGPGIGQEIASCSWTPLVIVPESCPPLWKDPLRLARPSGLPLLELKSLCSEAGF